MLTHEQISAVAENIIKELQGTTYLEGIAICEVVKHHLLTRSPIER